MFFYDTCALLTNYQKIFQNNEQFYISDITLLELENIKTSSHKDEDTKYQARQVIHLLEDNLSKYKVIIYNKDVRKYYKKYLSSFEETNDIKIISCALSLKDKQTVFVTNDLACKQIAQTVIQTTLLTESGKDTYTGYTVVDCKTEDEVNSFYMNISGDKEYLNNHYILVQYNDEIIDRYICQDNKLKKLNFPCFNSKQLGKIKPKDSYQFVAMDSLMRNKITVLRGPAGSGKSWLALGYLFDLLEKGKIDKIIIFCNTVATIGAARLGFYPGTKDEKLLDSQIGNFLSSKLGSKDEVIKLLSEEKIILLPVSDIRGYDTTNMNAGIYITEAQNLDINLMKLILQRIGDDSICILDGDDTTQVDSAGYAGNKNGLRRVSKIFRGQDIYGEITLKEIYRSEIAKIAELL